MSGGSLHGIGDAGLERVSNGRPVDPVGRVSGSTIFFVGSRCLVGQTNPGGVDDRVFSGFGIFGSIHSRDSAAPYLHSREQALLRWVA